MKYPKANLSTCNWWLLLLAIPFLAQCGAPTENEADSIATKDANKKRYFFTGHSYRWYDKGNTVDSRLEELDYSDFDQIWFGGDVCSETTRDPKTIEYLDSLFDLGNPGNFWALGNHDIRNKNLELIEAKTKRPTFYTSNINGMTVLVLNSTLEQVYRDDYEQLCVESQKQYDLINRVCDTISESSHLIVMTHHLLWHAATKTWMFNNEVKPMWSTPCDSTDTWENKVYPALAKARKRGVNVWCLSGDSGIRHKRGYGFYTDSLGIQMLASGLGKSYYSRAQDTEYTREDHVLVLEHDLEAKSLEYVYMNLDTLLADQKAGKPIVYEQKPLSLR